MSGRTVFTLLMLFILLGMGILWFVNRPTPQEAAFKSFINELRQGSAEKARYYLLDNSFGKFILASKIKDADGFDLKDGLHGWGDDVERLETLVKQNIPLIRGRIRNLEFTNLTTQRLESDKNVAYVLFEIDFSIKEQLDIPGIQSSCNGIAEMRRVDGKWVIEKGTFDFIIAGRSLKFYAENY